MRSLGLQAGLCLTQEGPQLNKATSSCLRLTVVLSSYLYSKTDISFVVSDPILVHFISSARQPFPPLFSGGTEDENWLASGLKSRRKRGKNDRMKWKRRVKGRVTIIAISSLSPPLCFFLGRGYSECQLCSAAVQCTLLQRSQPRCTPSTPIELPALVINSEPCAVTAGLWTQQLAAGRQALVHRLCSPISCTQLSSSSPSIQSTTAAAGERGLFQRHCWLECLHHTFFFTSSFLNFQPYRHIRPLSCTAGLICLSGLAFCLSFSFFPSQIVHLSQLLLHYSHLAFSHPPILLLSSMPRLKINFRSFLQLSPFFLLPTCFSVSPMSLLSLCFVVPISLFPLCWLPCLSFSTPFSVVLSHFCHSLLFPHNFHLILCHSAAI